MPYNTGNNPYTMAGNWVGTWGMRPPDLGHQSVSDYFQQNQNMIGSYNQGHGSLSRFLMQQYPNWNNSQVGGVGTPRPQPRPQNPLLGTTGYNPQVPGDPYTGDVPNVYNPNPNTQTNTYAPGVPKYGLPQPPPQNPLLGSADYRFGGGLPPTPKFPNPQPGIGGYRTGGWF